MKRASITLAICMTLAAPAALATTVFNNGGPSSNDGLPIFGAIGSNNGVTSDDFTVAAVTTIQSVGFWFNNYNGIAGWDGKISYGIRADVGGAPGALLASGTGLNVTAAGGGYPWCCGGATSELVTFDLQSGFVASAGTTYWLELGGAGGPSPWWVTAGTGGNAIYSGYRSGYEQAFYLSDTVTNPVPEPETYAMLMVGLALIGTATRRRKMGSKA